MASLYQVPNLPKRLKIDATFIPTNELCPVQSHTLIDNVGDEHYNFTLTSHTMADLSDTVNQERIASDKT